MGLPTLLLVGTCPPVPGITPSKRPTGGPMRPPPGSARGGLKRDIRRSDARVPQRRCPEDQRVAGLDRLQAGSQPRAGIVAARRQVLVDAGRNRRRPPASRPAAAPASGCRPTWRHGHSQSASRHRKSLRKEEAHPASWRSIPQRVFWRIAAAIGRSGAVARKSPVFRALSAPRRPATPSVSRILRRSRSISRPSHRSCAQSQTACVGITLQSQLICTGNHP